MNTQYSNARMTGFCHLLSLITLVRDLQVHAHGEPGALDALYNEYGGVEKARWISCNLRIGDSADQLAEKLCSQITRYIAECLWSEAEILALNALDDIISHIQSKIRIVI